MSEVSMRHTIKRHVDAIGPEAHWQRIEDGFGPGIPDINVCYAGVEYWLEAKFMDVEKLPKRESTPIRIGLKSEQTEWLTLRRRAGGHAGVIYKCDGWWYVFNSSFQAIRDGLTQAALDDIAKVKTKHLNIKDVFSALRTV